MMAMAACMPPPAGSATVEPGRAWHTEFVASARAEKARDGQVVEIVTYPLGVRTRLTVTSDGAVDHTRVGGVDGVVANADAISHTGTKTLHDDVCGGGQFEDDGFTFVLFHVDATSIDVAEGSVRVKGEFNRSETTRGIDSNYLRSVVGEDPRGSRTGTHRARSSTESDSSAPLLTLTRCGRVLRLHLV